MEVGDHNDNDDQTYDTLGGKEESKYIVRGRGKGEQPQGGALPKREETTSGTPSPVITNM